MSDLPDFDSSHDEEARAIDRELDEFDQQLGPSLAQIFQPPADLEGRTQRRATSNLLDRSLLGAASDLLTVGWQTMWCIFGPDTETEQPDPSSEEQHHV